MKILDQNPKEYFDKIIDTEPKNRTWVLSFILNIVLGAAAITCYFVFSGRENQAIEAKIESDRKADLYKDHILKDSKDCNRAINEANAAKDLYYQTKIDELQKMYNQELKERADKVERDLRAINKRMGR